MIGLLIRFLRGLRLVPVVLCAVIALFALKALGLALDGGYLFDNTANIDDAVEITGAVGPAVRAPARPSTPVSKQSWAQEMFNFPGGRAPAAPPALSSRPPTPSNLDITGAVGEAPSPAARIPAAKAPANAEPAAPGGEKPAGNADPAARKPPSPEIPAGLAGTPVQLNVDHPVSPAERAILESLQKRRADLDARAHDLDVREDLLRAAEKRVGGRIDELKELETRINAILQQRDEAETARFKNVVTMYENMKAKDAAKIFDGLDPKILTDVARAINPRTMSEILAQMTPEIAQRLTAELAARPDKKDQPTEADLPKIQGNPVSN